MTERQASPVASVSVPGRSRLLLTSLLLVLVNLIPLVGVLFFDWQVIELMVLFWAENVVIGVLYIARLVVLYRTRQQGSLLFSIVFFTFHFGAFCLGHLVFILSLFHPGDPSGFSVLVLLLPLAALLVSHLMSFQLNFIGQGEYRRVDEQSLMIGPYKRVVVLHLAQPVRAGHDPGLGAGGILGRARAEVLECRSNRHAHAGDLRHLGRSALRARGAAPGFRRPI